MNSDPYNLVFEKEGSLLATAFFGTRYDAVPYVRVSITTISDGSSTRVIASPSVVSNRGSAFERETEITNSGDVQKILEDMKAKIESRK